MKTVIDGRKYDTDTAEVVGYYSNGCCCTDCHWYGETLYRKHTGEYYLHGKGGALSHYAEAVGSNTWACGERITPLSDDDARCWAERNATYERYVACFGEPDE